MKNNVWLSTSDLFVEYMITKMELGYEPKYTMEEFESFLQYLSIYVDIDGIDNSREDMLYDFYTKMYEYHWMYFDDNNRKIFVPHIKLEDNDVLVATNRLGRHDRYTTNIPKMKRTDRKKIKKYIEYFLCTYEKRKIDMDAVVSEENIHLAKIMTVKLIYNIVRNYNISLVHQRLFNMNFSEMNRTMPDENIVSLPGKDLVDFYFVVYQRIAYLLSKDNELMISNDKEFCLGYSNYRCIMEGYEQYISLCENNLFVLDVHTDQEKLDIDVPLEVRIYENDVKKLVRMLDSKR